MKVFIVYGLIDPITNELRYVGYTKNLKQRITSHYTPSALSKKRHRNHWLKSLLAIGKKAEVIVLEKYYTKFEACQAETELIEYYRWIGCNLTNQILGGEGGATRIGYKNSPEMQAKIAAGNRGQKRSKEAKEKMRQAKLGTKQSPETIAKRANKQRGRPGGMAGKKQSEEAKSKISKSLFGKKRIDSWKIKQSDWHIIEQMFDDKISKVKIAKSFNVGVRTIRYLLRYIKSHK